MISKKDEIRNALNNYDVNLLIQAVPSLTFNDASNYILRWKENFEYEKKMIHEYVEYSEVFDEFDRIIDELLNINDERKAKKN